MPRIAAAILAAVVACGGTALGASSITQSSRGDCSPNFGIVNAPVHVDCNNPDKISQLFEEQLRLQRAKQNLENAQDLPPAVKDALARGDLAEAGAALDQAIQQREAQGGKLAEPYLARAEIYTQLGERAKAFGYYEKAYQREPSNPKYIIAYASEEPRPEKAEELFKRALDLLRVQDPARTETRAAIAQSLNGLAGVYEVTDRYALASIVLNQSVEIYRNLAKVAPAESSALVSTLNRLALSELRNGRVEEASSAIDEALNVIRTSRDPLDGVAPTALAMRSLLSRLMNRSKEANDALAELFDLKTSFQTAGKQFPENLLVIAPFLRDATDPAARLAGLDEAVSAARRVVARNPQMSLLLIATLSMQASQFQSVGNMDAAESALKEAVQFARSFTSWSADEKLLLPMTLRQLGSLYASTRRDLAISLLEEAIGHLRDHVPPGRTREQMLVRVMLDAADVHRRADRLKDAAGYAEEALKICQDRSQRWTCDMALVADVLNARASIDVQQKRFQDAEGGLKQAIEVVTQLERINPYQAARSREITLTALVEVYLALERIDDAEGRLRELLEVEKRLFEEEPATFVDKLAATIGNIALVHSKKGRMNAAENAYKEAIDLARRTLAQHKLSAFALVPPLNSLMQFYIQTERSALMIPLLEEMRDLTEEAARINPAVLRALGAMYAGLGVAYSDTDRLDLARSSYERAVAIQRDLVRKDRGHSRELAQTLMQLAVFHGDTRKFTEGIAIAQEAVALQKQLAMQDAERFKPDLAAGLSRLSNLLLSAEMPKEAMPTAKESAALHTALFSSDPAAYRARYADALELLGSSYDKTGDLNAAETSYGQAIKLYREMPPGDGNEPLALTLNKLGSVHLNLRQFKKAEASYTEARRILTRMPASPERASNELLVIDNLASLYEKTRRAKQAAELRRKAAPLRQQGVQKPKSQEHGPSAPGPADIKR